MIFKRKIYEKFLAWKQESCGRKALLVEGARRIGKSTVVEEFARQEYRSYILIDFVKASEDVKSYFHLHLNDLDTFYMLLAVQYGVELYPRESLIIFDEVQLFPKAREAMKYLVADGRYDFMETGSLISIKENVKDIVIPSEERHIRMYPMDFEEFCWALNEAPLISYIRRCFEKREPLERSIHDKAMLLFKQYLLVGGMPKVVAEFLEGQKSFGAADTEKRDILELYRGDIMKIRAQYRAKVLTIFDQMADDVRDLPQGNTTIGCVITNARLSKAQCNKIASITHNAYARTIFPVHTMSDGDTVFVMSTGECDAMPDAVGAFAVQAMSQAIIRAITHAEAAYGLPSCQSIHRIPQERK